MAEIAQILKVLVTCILVITFVMVIASAYRQHQVVSSMATLADATSSIAMRLTLDELARVDNAGNKYSYILDPSKLGNLTFSHEIGGFSFAFQVSISYKHENAEVTFGPYGPSPASDRSNCNLTVACSLWLNDRLIPGKLKVVAWYA